MKLRNLIILGICFLNFLVGNNLRDNSKIINLSNYDYPKPEHFLQNDYTIAIIGTNDIHGVAFEDQSYDFVNNQSYSTGGLEYMSSQIKALINEWRNRCVLLDAGDQFQGGFENILSNGEIITEFFNTIKFEGAAIGNHEFDFGMNFLRDRIESAKFEYLSANIFNDKDEDISKIFKNANTIKIHKLDKVKIGVIGLATLETPATTTGNLEGLKFKDYKPILEKISVILRPYVNAIILLSHVGMKCQYPDRYELKMRKKKEIDFNECTDVEGEMIDLLKSLKPGTIDAVVGGHKHAINTIWVNGIPFISTNNLGRYFNVMYLKFDSNYKLKVDDTLIEGPIPVCSKIFEKNKLCELFDESENQGKLYNYSFHHNIIYRDNNLRKTYDYYREKLQPYMKKLSLSKSFLEKIETGDFAIGNFVVDCFKNSINSDVSIINPGAFRNIWKPGDITEYKYLNMFPFDNDMYSAMISGSDLIKLISSVTGYDGFYPLSGVRVYVERNKSFPSKGNVTKVVLLDSNGKESEIVKDKMFKISSTAFLLKLYGDSFKLVKDWWKPNLIKEADMDKDYIHKCLEKTAFIDKNSNMEHLRTIFTN